MFDYKDVNEHYYLEEGLGKPYALGGATVAVRIQNWKRQYAPHDPIVVISGRVKAQRRSRGYVYSEWI